MKRLARILVILFSLIGISVPAQANNGMTDMMRIMMEMFLWMMGGGAGGMSPSNMGSLGSMGGMGGMANPLLASSMLGNPLLGNSFLGGSSYGNPSGWGYGSPYNARGFNTTPGYPGSSVYLNPYSSPYANPYTNSYINPYSNPYNSSYRNPYESPYYGNAFGNQPFSRNSNNPYYRSEPGGRGAQGSSFDQAAPFVMPPDIVNSDEQSLAKPPAMTMEPKFQTPPSPQVRSVSPAVADYASRNQAGRADSLLFGSWQGVNGELLELGDKHFRLRSKNSDLQGTYELKNSILKAAIEDRKDPVYMQYRMSDGHLMFRSEDGQLMLFRRLQ